MAGLSTPVEPKLFVQRVIEVYEKAERLNQNSFGGEFKESLDKAASKFINQNKACEGSKVRFRVTFRVVIGHFRAILGHFLGENLTFNLGIVTTRVSRPVLRYAIEKVESNFGRSVFGGEIQPSFDCFQVH